ncbi:MAG TPA: ferric reductase-like transmembrane domain-containing protein [Gammaproteobacteria bacterium]
MKNIKRAFLLLVLLLGGSWLLADTLLPEPFTYFSFRTVFVQFTGVLGIGLMSAAMLLALRTRMLERLLGGLDKNYRLHKWLGIGALIVTVLHWWWAQGTKWMVGWGWLARPERRHRGGGGETLSWLEQWLRSQRGLAETLGEWAFYAAVVLIVLALIKRFPYHLFQKTHKLLAAAYLVFVYHTIVLLKADYWSQPVGWLVTLLLLGGTLAAVVVLLGKVGSRRKVAGEITCLEYYPALQVIEGTILLQPGWPGHKPGQFAFVTSDRHEGAHPYTIASAWDEGQRCLVFIVKGLGDYTSHLRDKLEVGLPVCVEGPYGSFDFEDDKPRQIWVGAGIGITPFIARMKQLAKAPGSQRVDLFHTTRDFEQSAIDKLKADAAAANVALHLHVSGRDPRLTGGRLREAVPQWRDASVWFCGPTAFGKALRNDLVGNGLAAEDFHQELFEMR